MHVHVEEVFLGYDSSKPMGAMVYDPILERVVVTRDVRYEDESFVAAKQLYTATGASSETRRQSIRRNSIKLLLSYSVRMMMSMYPFRFDRYRSTVSVGGWCSGWT